MTPEERALAATQLRNLAELTRYQIGQVIGEAPSVYHARQLAAWTAESVALLAEMLATVIEDRADMNEVPL